MADLWSSYASQLPMGASSRDAIVGQTEWGSPVYASPMGVKYWEPIQGETQRGSVARALLDGITSDPWGAVKSGAGAVASGVAEALSAPYRAWKGEAVTNGDVFNTAGIAQLGAMPMRAPEGALRSGAMGSTSAADDVMGLLRSGRGSEVTDDLMAAADQAYLSSIYDLPLDEASRMARAREMGFNTSRPMYHGTKSDFSGFNSMPWATDDASFAWDYAGLSDGANIAPVVMRADSTLNADMLPQRITVPEFYNAALDVAGGVDDEIIGRLSSSLDSAPAGEFMRHEMWNPPESRIPREVIDRSMSDIRDIGLDSISMTEGGAPTLGVLDPTAVRSRFARFDPRLSHLRNLSAGVGGLALLPYLGDEE